jgi:hypothetical protein
VLTGFNRLHSANTLAEIIQRDLTTAPLFLATTSGRCPTGLPELRVTTETLITTSLSLLKPKVR